MPTNYDRIFIRKKENHDVNNCPLVSIGLPVYNGEKYIYNSIQAVLNQTYKNLELIICDNCSNDRTPIICKEIQNSDNRIKFYRNSKNIGASHNYNMTFKLSKGKYFAWCAHDDLYHKRYIEKCLRELENDPQAVLAYAKTINIDENGIEIGYDATKLKVESNKASERFESLIQYGIKCNPVFGLIRRDILQETKLIEHHAMGDKRFLAKLALKGPFKEIKSYLFYRRVHEGQSAKMMNNYRKWAIWFDPKLRGKHLFPNISLYLEFVRSVLKEKKLSFYEKKACFLVLLRWLIKHNNMLMSDVKVYLHKKSAIF